MWLKFRMKCYNFGCNVGIKSIKIKCWNCGSNVTVGNFRYAPCGLLTNFRSGSYNLWPGSKSGPCWRLAYYSEKVVGPLAWPYLYIPTPLLLGNQIDRFISGTSTGLWHSCNGWDPRRCMANFGPTRRVAWSWVGRTNNTTAWRNSTQQCKS